jgi:hypothetical protein
MNVYGLARFFLAGLVLLALAACGESPINVAALKKEPKKYVGSDTCKLCHLEHYDSWKMTLHSRMLQDAQKNRDAIVAPLDEKVIRADLAKAKLKIPVDQVYIPKEEDIKYTIGSQWKQRFLVEKNGKLFIPPIVYNIDSHRWAPWAEGDPDWDKQPWILLCGGCHATGVDIKKNTFVEPGVGCEACHGPGSWHAALPKTAVFEKRQTIINPSKLTMGVAVQICGSCHTRGESTQVKGAGWPVGYEPGKAIGPFLKETTFEAGDVNGVYTDAFANGHHRQYLDWKQSVHYQEGVTCTSCHFVHQIGMPPTRSQTVQAGSKQCLSCHEIINKNLGHSIHSFGNCIGCHMPKLARSAESGEIRTHVFVCLLPKESLADPAVPNSCDGCHFFRGESLEYLQAAYDALAKLPVPVGSPVKMAIPETAAPKEAPQKGEAAQKSPKK